MLEFNGIPQNVVDKMFQPFFTGEEETGLGLSLADDIIKAHWGELKVEIKENEGSEFVIDWLTGINREVTLSNRALHLPKN